MGAPGPGPAAAAAVAAGEPSRAAPGPSVGEPGDAVDVSLCPICLDDCSRPTLTVCESCSITGTMNES